MTKPKLKWLLGEKNSPDFSTAKTTLPDTPNEKLYFGKLPVEKLSLEGLKMKIGDLEVSLKDTDKVVVNTDTIVGDGVGGTLVVTTKSTPGFGAMSTSPVKVQRARVFSESATEKVAALVDQIKVLNIPVTETNFENRVFNKIYLNSSDD